MELERSQRLIAGCAGVAAIVVGWAMLAATVNRLYLPGPLAIATQLPQDGFFYKSFLDSRTLLGAGVTEDLLPSLWRMGAGLTLSILLGVVGGMILGLRPRLAEYLSWLMNFARAIPPPAILGVWFVLFGAGDGPKIFLIAVTVVWPVLLNTIDGVESVDKQRLQVARVFQIPFRTQVSQIYLMSALPKIMSGIRTSLGFALVMMVITEFYAASDGIGLRIKNDAGIYFDFNDMWACLVVLALVGVGLNAALSTLENRVLAWHRGASGDNAR